MSVQRFISTSFWDDEWIQTLQANEKLLYLYLLTNPLTNIAGVYKITPRRMFFDTGIPEADIESILCGFSADGKAHLRFGYIVIPAWPAHQRLDGHKTLRDGVDKILDDLSPEMLSFLYQVGYRYESSKIRSISTHKGYPMDSLPIAYRYPMDSLPIADPYPPSYSDSDSDTDTDTDTDTNIVKPECVQPVDNSEEKQREVAAMLDTIFPGIPGIKMGAARVHDPPTPGTSSNEW